MACWCVFVWQGWEGSSNALLQQAPIVQRSSLSFHLPEFPQTQPVACVLIGFVWYRLCWQGWDEMVQLPPNAVGARAAQKAALAGELYCQPCTVRSSRPVAKAAGVHRGMCLRLCACQQRPAAAM